MATSTWNSITVPAGTDLYNIAADLKTMAESATVIIPVANTTARAAVAAATTPSATNPLYVHRADAPTGAELEVSEDGTNWSTILAGPTSTTTVTMTSGWVEAYSGSAGKIYRDGGWAWLEGIVARTSGSSLTIGTIPAGYRPPRTLNLALTMENGSSAPGPGAFLEVTTGGNLIIHVQTGVTWNENTWVMLHPAPWRIGG